MSHVASLVDQAPFDDLVEELPDRAPMDHPLVPVLRTSAGA